MSQLIMGEGVQKLLLYCNTIEQTIGTIKYIRNFIPNIFLQLL